MKEKLNKIPPPLRKQSLLRFAGAGACFCLLWVVEAVYHQLALCLPFLGMAVFSATSGALLVWRAERGKILVLEGVCRQVDTTLFRRRPKALVMECCGCQVKVYLRSRVRDVTPGDALRVLFLSSPKVQPIQPEQQEAATHYAPQQAVTNREAENTEDALSFGQLQTQITQWVQREYPNARWVWKFPDAKARFQRGEDVAILLNRAGGYREAVIRLEGKRLFDVRYLPAPVEQPELEKSETNASHHEVEPAAEEPKSQPEPSRPEDYSLAAFEWVESHLAELNALYNECIAQQQNFLLLTGGDLPEPAALPALCRELERNGLSCRLGEEGVQIEIMRENRRKE